MKNLNNLLKLLLENNVDFVLIGGFAGALHGSSLVTRDIDICALCSPETITQLRDILKDLHPVHRMTPQKLSFLENPQSLNNVKNIYLSCNLGVLDIISEVTGVGNFERVKSKAIKVSLFGHTCNVISIDDLIKAKKAIGRSKDLIAIKELEAIKKRSHSS